MRRVTLILGAGASVEYGAPSTSELTDKVEQKLKHDDWIKHNNAFVTYLFIKEKLRDFLVESEAVHFERIYHCIHELIKFSRRVEEGFVDEYRYLLQPFLSLDKANGLLEEKKLRCLEQKYIQFIYEIVSSSCEKPKCKVQPLQEFINTLKATSTLRVYSLNYDDFCFQADPSLYTGFEDKSEGVFLKRTFWNMEDRHSLFQLHGSVRMGSPSPNKHFDFHDLAWFHDRKEAKKHAMRSASGSREMDGGSSQLHPIITGLSKLSRIQNIPFNYYYAMLPKDLFASETIILAGYGMNDLHINSWLKQSRVANPKQKIIIVDYLSEKELFFSEGRKAIEWIHSLRVKASEQFKWKVVPEKKGWYFDPESNASVWINGFQSFLTSQAYEDVL